MLSLHPLKLLYTLDNHAYTWHVTESIRGTACVAIVTIDKSRTFESTILHTHRVAHMHTHAHSFMYDFSRKFDIV